MLTRQTAAVSAAVLVVLVFYCEFAVPYLYSLDWKRDQSKNGLRVLAIADPQLQGYQNEPVWPLGALTRWDADHYLGSMFKRVWRFAEPDVLVVLGDVIDEAYTSSETDMNDYYARYNAIFQVDSPALVVPGDNDIGGEGREAQTVKHIELFEARHGKVNGLDAVKGITFVRLNLFGLILSTPVEIRQQLEAFVERMGRRIGDDQWPVILLSHLPVQSLQQSTRRWLLSNIRPDLILSGHTHDYDERNHTYEGGRIATEITVPTVSYRMGTSKMGAVLVTIDIPNRKMQPTLLALPTRYFHLSLYALWVVGTLLSPYWLGAIRSIGNRRRLNHEYQ